MLRCDYDIKKYSNVNYFSSLRLNVQMFEIDKCIHIVACYMLIVVEDIM